MKPLIESNPAVMMGKPVIRGTRLTVKDILEKLWGALRAQADSGVVPAWHKDIVAERLRRLDSGSETVSPWAEAKERIRAETKAG